MSHDDRDRGILTSTDRQWLRNQTNGSTSGTANQRDYQRRNAIRTRVTNALLDFQLLTEELPETLLRDIRVALHDDRAYSQSLSNGLAFLYMLANEREYLQHAITIGGRGGAFRFLTFEAALDDGITTARECTNWFRPPTSDGSPRQALYEIPPFEDISIQEMFSQWREYGNWTDPETGEKLYESGRYRPSEAKSLALANVKAAIVDVRADDGPEKLSVPSDLQYLVDHIEDNEAEQPSSDE